MSPLILVSLFVALSVLYIFARGLDQRPSTSVKSTYLLFVGVMLFTVLVDFVMRLPLSLGIRMPFVRVSLAAFLWAGFLYVRFIYALVSRRRDVLWWVLVALATVSSAASFVSVPPGLSLDPDLHYFAMSLSPQLELLIVLGVLIPGGYGLYLCARHFLRPRDAREKSIVALMLGGSALALAVWFFLLVVVPAFLPGHTLPLQLLSLSLLPHVYFMHRALTRRYFTVVDYEQIEEVSRNLFENVSEAAIVFDASGEVVQLNAPARGLLGDSVTSGELPHRIEGYDPAATYHHEPMSVRTATGERRLLVSQTAVEKSGLHLGRLLLIRDVTEQDRLDEMRRQMEERTRHTEKMEAVGQLAGGIAHDFNNQLMGITGYADLLREDVSGNKEMERLADGILRTTRRSANLTAQLLAFARRGPLVKTDVDLDQTVSDVVSLLEHSIDKRISIQQERRAAACWSEGDASQLQNAILNLTLNSRDAMPDGGDLTLQTDVVDLDAGFCDRSAFDISPGRYASVMVVDTGMGMDEAVLKRVFEPFFTTKTTTKGTGMGLAAVFGTVTSHAGAIDVSSTPGAGSTFTIYLPARDIRGPVVRDTPVADVPATFSPGARIMVVDDEQTVLDTASMMLSRLGYEVSSCRDGREAAEEFARRSDEVDLVILDIAMPRMGGVEAFDAMRKTDPGVRVLVASGYSIGGEVQHLLDAGALGFIQKPFRRSELARRVAEALGRARTT